MIRRADDEVMRAMEKAQPVQGGVPLLYERNRNTHRQEKIADYIDPPRVLSADRPLC